MTGEEINSVLEKQREYYKSGETISVKFRVQQLKKLYNTVKKYEFEINEALKKDLGKSNFEAFMCESGLVLTEISYLIKHTKKFAKRKMLLFINVLCLLVKFVENSILTKNASNLMHF